MKLTLWLSGTAIAGLLLSAGPALAQSDEVVAHVPFAFVVGTTVMPAGDYIVAAVSDDPALVRVEQVKGRAYATVITNWGGGDVGTHAALTFREYGHAKFLSRIMVPGEDAREVALPLSEIQQDLVQLASASPATPSTGGAE